jgi:hypothetical protein
MPGKVGVQQCKSRPTTVYYTMITLFVQFLFLPIDGSTYLQGSFLVRYVVARACRTTGHSRSVSVLQHPVILCTDI